MGSDVTITVQGGRPRLLDDATTLVEACERRWSRFLDASELSQLNAARGRPVVLPRDTYELVAAAVRCWELTAGRFDPTVLDAVQAAGYDRSFEQATLTARASAPAPGCADIDLDDSLAAVSLPTGVSIDLGGIAKGHTADLVVELLLDAGAAGAVADLGGDVRVGGEPPGGAWTIGVADPFDDERDLMTLRLVTGAAATSSVRRRRWRDSGRELHHLIDPRTGQPATGIPTAVTILAETAAWAEVTAKAALIAGDEAASVVRAAGATGLAVHDDGRVVAFDGLEAFS